MCGLVGIAGDTTGTWKDLFNQLLLFDSLRGMHSTGAGFVGRFGEEKLSVVKRPGHPFNLFHADEYDDAMATRQSYKAILGHNRHATVGEKTEANAHPFVFENVVGMHNGTLDKLSVMDLHNYKDYGTDSEAIFSTINEFGIKKAISLMSGAWALVYYDKRDNTLNFIRNDKRPLHYCYSADRCTLIWASELEMLKYVMERCHKKVEQGKDGNPKFYTTTKDTLYSWKIPKSCNDKFDSPQQETMEGKKFAYAYTGPFTAASAQRANTGSGTARTMGTVPGYNKSDTIKPFFDRMNTKKFRPPYKDQYGRVFTKNEYFPMVGEGCCCCDKNNQKWGEFVHVLGAYQGYHTPYLCEECYNDSDTYELVNWAI